MAFYFLAMVVVWNAAVVLITMVWSICATQEVSIRWPGFLMRGFRWMFLGSSMS